MMIRPLLAFVIGLSNALHKFGPKIALEDIDKEFLQKFEIWILDQGKSITMDYVCCSILLCLILLSRMLKANWTKLTLTW